MKRCSTFLLPTLVTAVFLTLEATPVRAQATLSLTGGVNLATLHDSDETLSPGLESLTRMSIGLAATLPVSDRFGVQIGGRYAQKGGRLNVLRVIATMDYTPSEIGEIPPGSSFDADYEMDYVELSALARVGFPLSGDRVSGHLLAGPALGLQSSCAGVVSVSGPDVLAVNLSRDCDEPDNDFQKIDVGLAGGAGIDIGLTDSIDAHLGLLYILGFSNVFEDVGGSVKHRVLTIQTGLAIPIG